MKEKWRWIRDCCVDGPHYKVSNKGRVKSVDRIIHFWDGRRRFYPGKVLSPGLNKMTKYWAINLHFGEDKRRIHDLVCRAFVGLPPTVLHEVNHKDLNKGNNHADNLEWVTSAENKEHALSLGVIYGKTGKRGPQKKTLARLGFGQHFVDTQSKTSK